MRIIIEIDGQESKLVTPTPETLSFSSAENAGAAPDLATNQTGEVEALRAVPALDAGAAPKELWLDRQESVSDEVSPPDKSRDTDAGAAPK